MQKYYSKKLLFLAFLLFALQLLLPGINASAVTNNTVLPPSNVTSQLLTPDDVKLSWGTVFEATSYKIYQIIDGQIKFIASSSSNSYTRNNLPEGSYTYVVSTVSAYGESGPSAPISVNISYPQMLAPTTLTSTLKNGNDIVLSWSTSQYAEKYNVYQISTTGEKTLINSLTGTSFTVVNAPEGTYTYAVSAQNSLYGESPLSSYTKTDVVFPVMTSPGNLAFTLSSGNNVNLKWISVNYATAYKIYEIIGDEKVLKSTVTGTTVTYTNMPAGDYTYEVHSYSDRFGESSEGSKVTVSVADIVMAAPLNFTYSLKNVNDVVLTWSSTSNATGYKVYQVIDGEKILKSTVTGTSVTYTNLSSGDYTYEVHSYSDRFGESEEGSQTSFSLTLPSMESPDGITNNITNGNDITLKWNAVTYATGYKIYQVVNGEKILKSTITGTTITYTNMPAGDYTYEVHSYSDRFGESETGSLTSLSLVWPVMNAPDNLSYSISNGNDITLKWNTVPYATSYKVYQVIDGEKILKSTVTGTTITYLNMAGGDYHYEVYSYSTRFDQSLDGSVLDFTLTLPTMEPPSSLLQTIINATDFTLSWNTSLYANSYKVYQIIDGQKVLKSTVTGTSITYRNMLPGEYSFEIHSYSARFGESPNGINILVTLNGQTVQPPTNLTYTIANGNDITLKWTAAPYANKYNIYQVINGQKVLIKSVTTTSVNFANTPEGDYNYIINSVSQILGESPDGADVSFSLVFPTMTAPSNLTTKIQNGNDILLSWSPVAYSTSYRIYEIIDGQEVLKTTTASTSLTFSNVSASEHTYIVRSVSTRFGESQEGSSTTIDIVFPVMQAPSNLTTSIIKGNDIVLKWTASTYATAYNVYQIIDEQKILRKTVTSPTITFTNMPEGDYTYEVYSYSSRFNESPLGSSVSFPLIWPVMQAPNNLINSIINGNDIILKWTASTYATAYNIYQVIDGQKILRKTVTSPTVTFTNMPEGDYTYEVYSYSTRFNESPLGSSTSLSVVWPVVQPPTVTSAVSNINNITLSWKAVSWANEYRVYSLIDNTKVLIYKGTALSYKIYNLSEDTHKYEVTAYSTRFGESVPSNCISETIVYPLMESPVANLKLLDNTSALISWNIVTYANGYNLYEIINGNHELVASNINALSYTVTNLSYRDHQYYVTSFSNSFGESNPSQIVTAKLIVDTVAPVTTTDAPKDWANKNPLTITLSPSDKDTGVAHTYYSIDSGNFIEATSFTITEKGIHNVSFYSVDNVGNVEKTQTIEVKIDADAPVTTVDAPKDWINTSPLTVTLSPSDKDSGVAHTYYSINDANFIEGTSFTITEKGIHSVSFYSVDNVGNVEKTQTIEVKIDADAPVTTVDAPKDWINASPLTVTLSPSDKNSGVAHTYYSMDDANFIEGTSFTITEKGIHSVSFYSVDNVGNIEKTQTIEIKIDTDAPVTTADAPQDWTNKSPLTVTLSPSDKDSGVAHTYYSIDGSNFVEGTSFTLTEEGIHNVSFYSVDMSGNIENTKTIKVKIDKSMPVITFNMSYEYKLGSTIQLDYTALDKLSGVASEKITVFEPNSLIGNIVTKGQPISLDKPGTYKVVITVTDAAGNTTIVEKQFVVYIPANIQVTSKVINNNNGIFTVRVDMPQGYNPKDLDLNTATLNGVSALKSNNGYYNQAKLGQFKFERSDFAWTSPETFIEFRCYINGYLIIGQTTIKVNNV